MYNDRRSILDLDNAIRWVLLKHNSSLAQLATLRVHSLLRLSKYANGWIRHWSTYQVGILAFIHGYVPRSQGHVTTDLQFPSILTNLLIWLHKQISCAIKNSKFLSCIQNSDKQIGISINESSTTSVSAPGQTMISTMSEPQNNELTRTINVNQNNNYIPYNEILVGLDPMNPQELPNPIWFNTLCLLGFLVFFRLLGYIVLRIYHKPGWQEVDRIDSEETLIDLTITIVLCDRTLPLWGTTITPIRHNKITIIWLI